MAKQQAHYEVLEKLLQYFEKQDNLEGETAGPTVVNIPGLEFVSYITFEGVPILPPVMTPLQRDEMLLYRKHFIASETRMAAKTKARLLRRVEDVLAEIEEQQRRVESRQSGLSVDCTSGERSNHRIHESDNAVRNPATDTTTEENQESEIVSAVSSLKDKVLQGYSWEDNTHNTGQAVTIGLEENSVMHRQNEGSVFQQIAEVNNSQNRPQNESLLVGIEHKSNDRTHPNTVRSFESPSQNVHSISHIETVNTPPPARLTPTWSSELPKSSPPQKDRSSTLTLTQLAEVIHGVNSEENIRSVGNENVGHEEEKEGFHVGSVNTEKAVNEEVRNDAESIDKERNVSEDRSQPTSESEDPHDNMSTEPGREDSEPEILVDQSQSEEGELPTDMTMGLQLLRQKLQQQQNTQSQTSLSEHVMRSTTSSEHRGTVRLAHLSSQASLPLDVISASQDSITSSKKQSTAFRIQQSLFKAPQLADRESAASSVIEGDDLMNTVIVRERSETENQAEDRILQVNKASNPTQVQEFDSDKENEQPDHPLLSRAAQAFEGTPNVSPEKPLSTVTTGLNASPKDPRITNENDHEPNQELLAKIVDAHQGGSLQFGEGNLQQVSEDDNETMAGEEGSNVIIKDVNAASPGPTKTPNLSKISCTDSDDERKNNNDPAGEEADESGPYLHSVTTDELYTKSTELAKYMHASADTMQDSLCTLPQIQVQVGKGDEAVTKEQLTPRTDYDDALPSYSETLPIEIETTPVKTSLILQPVNTKENSERSHGESEKVMDREEQPCSNIDQRIINQEATKSTRSQSSGKSSQERVRKNSYTLEHPSPALVAAQTEDMTASCRKSDLTGSMEDLRIKPVQRKLDLEQQGRQMNSYTTGRVTGVDERGHVEVEEHGESDTAGVVVLPVVLPADEDAERSGKQEHLQRYLQALHTTSGVPDTSEDEDSTLGFQTQLSTGRNQPVSTGVVPQLTPGLPKQQGASDAAVLQHQMAYFDQLQQQLMQQQQTQLQQLLVEQEKQQKLFKQELLKQKNKFCEKKHSPEKLPTQPLQPPGQSQHPSLGQDQLQAWIQQLQGFPQLTHSLPTNPQLSALSQSGQQIGQSLPLDALANQLRALGIQQNTEGNNYPSPLLQKYVSQPRQVMLTQQEMIARSPTMGTGSHGDTEFGRLYRNLQHAGSSRDVTTTNTAVRPESGLSNASTLTPEDKRTPAVVNNASRQASRVDNNYSDLSRPLSDLSYISEALRPQSAPTPRIEGTAAFGDAHELGGPAGPSGVYYDSSVPTINNRPDLNNSHLSPGLLRIQKASPLPQPLQSVFNHNEPIGVLEESYNSHNVTLSSEKSVHFANPVYETQFIEQQHISVSENNMRGGGSVYRLKPGVDLNRCFTKVTAAVRGYLTRRLLHTGKVQQLIKTIRDTAEFAIHFQQESPIKRGVYSDQDKRLQERVINQLTAAMYEIHDIFFETTVAERMMYIQQDRLLERERIFKEHPEQDSAEKKRVSAATLKARERKKKILAAEESVFGQARPKSAPPSSRSPRKPRTADLRALKPLQSNTSPRKPSARDNRPVSVLKDTKAGVNKVSVPRKTHPQNKQQVTKPRTKTTVTSTVAKKIPQSAKLPVRKIARPATTPASHQQQSSSSLTPASTAMPTGSTVGGSSRSSNTARTVVNARPTQSSSTPVTTSYSHRNTGLSAAKTAAH